MDDTEVTPPTAEQVLALFDEAERDNPDFAVFLMMAVVTGARRAALCALRWSDFGVRGVTLARVISDGPDGPVEVATRGRVKSRPQTMAVASETMVALTAHRQRMAERAKACGVELPADAYVFSEDPAGRRFLHPDTVSHRFSRLCARLGLDGVRLHDLRHFVATTLLSEGVDLATVAGRLGHARGGQTTLGVYAHFLPAPDRAAELLARLLQVRRTRPRPTKRASGWRTGISCRRTAENGESDVGLEAFHGALDRGARRQAVEGASGGPAAGTAAPSLR